MEAEKPLHISVLLQECLHYLAPVSGGIYVDGTLGLGGHSEAILRASSPDGRLIGFDWDENALCRATERLSPFGERFCWQRRNFAEIAEGLRQLGIEQIDGLLLDVGLSSLQLDLPVGGAEGGRGFSFQRDEFLDMRMDSRREVTAAHILATATEAELADIFYYYGEERQARPIAAAIVGERKKQPVTTTKALARLVAAAVPRRFHPKKIHVATKTFQALRIAVNGELENLARVVDTGASFLKPGASFCIISFHSLEDRIVKKAFGEHPLLTTITRRPVMAAAKEVEDNPRARSARLRVARRR